MFLTNLVDRIVLGSRSQFDLCSDVGLFGISAVLTTTSSGHHIYGVAKDVGAGVDVHRTRGTRVNCRFRFSQRIRGVRVATHKAR